MSNNGNLFKKLKMGGQMKIQYEWNIFDIYNSRLNKNRNVYIRKCNTLSVDGKAVKKINDLCSNALMMVT